MEAARTHSKSSNAVQCPGAARAASRAPTWARTLRHTAAQQPHDLDLVRDLVEHDAAAVRGVELVDAVRPHQKVVVVER